MYWLPSRPACVAPMYWAALDCIKYRQTDGSRVIKVLSLFLVPTLFNRTSLRGRNTLQSWSHGVKTNRPHKMRSLFNKTYRSAEPWFICCGVDLPLYKQGKERARDRCRNGCESVDNHTCGNWDRATLLASTWLFFISCTCIPDHDSF